MKTIILTSLLAISFNVSAEITNEKWDCYQDEDRLITLDFKHDTDKEYKYTNMRVTGILKKSKSYLDGINRRWDGINNDDNWSFLISPKGRGMYYRFLGDSKEASPSGVYSCNIRKPEPKEKIESEPETKPDESDYWDDDDI